MSKRSEVAFRLLSRVMDACSIIIAYLFAFFIRINLDTRPYFFEERPIDFVSSLLFLVLIWLIILELLGLYKKDVIFSNKLSKEIIRLFFASILGIMAIITVSYFKTENIFPVRPVAIYTLILCFFFLLFFRLLLRLVRKMFLKKGHHGIVYTLIVGSDEHTQFLARYFDKHPESGYRVIGIVSSTKYIPDNMKKKQYSSVKEAMKKTHPDVVFQTDSRKTEYVYKQALNKHIMYYFVPSEGALTSQIGTLELIGSTPAIRVKTTPLDGDGEIIKRFFDILLSFIALIIFLIPILIIWTIMKISDPKHPVFYADIRLTKNNRRFKLYKFRSMKTEYSGMTPEKAFEKMGKPELAIKYRSNGDYIENDPRITKIGAFLRKTSLDELPQLWNILKGDISIVGPRALVPSELRSYDNRALLLSIKSGLTGLAQVSGRRGIPFEERRQLDLYYIRNWSFWMDIQIIFKTVITVFKHDGAK